MSGHPRRIVFRLELGGSAGWGHLTRCSALATEFRKREWECTAWTDGQLESAPDEMRAAFTTVVAAGPTWAEQPPRVAQDAAWIVVDAYGASDDALGALRVAAPRARLCVIDDEAKRTLKAAHVVLNARLGLERSPYAAGVRTLLGARHALLRAGLRTPAAISAPFATEHTPVLVMLGGTDPRGLTATVLDALADVDGRLIAPVVVRARSQVSDESVARALRRFTASTWIERVDASALAGWAGICRFAVSACGGTLYELAHLGLPFVGVVVAENQRAFADEVGRRWRLPIVDADRDDTQADVARAVRRVMAELRPAGSIARGPIGGVDGSGAARVADVLASA